MNKRVFNIGAASVIGQNRRVNQDKILVKVGEESEFGEFGLFAVADGMGGLSAGEKASNLCMEGLNKWWNEDLNQLLGLDVTLEEKVGILSEKLEQEFYRINEKIISFGNEIGKKLGTTLTVVLIYRNKYIIKHIGDSRVYIHGSGEAKVLTIDHSWVGEQVRRGIISREEARHHSKKNILTQCVGVRNDVEVDTQEGELGEEDALVLCSDGFYNVISDQEIQKYLKMYMKYGKSAQKLVEEFFDLIRRRDGNDDASVIVLW